MRRATIIAAMGAVGVIVVFWLIAAVAYEPWRRGRVRSAVLGSESWHVALLSAERAAFPSGEQFVAYCEGPTGAIACFERTHSTSYEVVLLEPHGYVSKEVPGTRRHFNGQTAWAAAVRSLGPQLRCSGLRVVFPPPDVLDGRIDASGRVSQVESY